MKIYTIRDIARLAGVSVTTVSRVLNHKPDVNAETRKRVERIISDCHFIGNINARGLKQTGDFFGIIIRGRSNPFLNALAEAILEKADGFPDNFITEFIDEMDDEFQTALKLIRQTRIKGLIFVGSRIDERAAVLGDLEIPLVFTTVSAAGTLLPGASSVAIDDRRMGSLVAETLLQLGHRRIAVFGSDPIAGDSLSMRYRGFCDTCRSYGLEHEQVCYRVTRFSLQAGYDTAMQFLPEHPEITAVFAMSDTVAIGTIRAALDLGISVPKELSVFGFDGIGLGQFTVPRLTTVIQPVEEIAARSMDLLFERNGSHTDSRHLLTEAVLCMRDSVTVPANHSTEA